SKDRRPGAARTSKGAISRARLRGSKGSRCRLLRRVWEDAGRAASDLRVVPYAVLPAPGKLAHYAELGIEEVVLQLPSADEKGVLKVLDEYASYL
ncbi:hypothetical protein ABZ726_28065, partial [Streptomyces hundungensis]